MKKIFEKIQKIYRIKKYNNGIIIKRKCFNLRKYLTWIALIGVVLSALIGILMIFSVIEFKDFSKYFFSFLTIAIGFSFALSSYNLYTNTKTILPLVSLSLIFVSILLVIMSLLIATDAEVFLKITVTIAVISVLFSIIVANITKLGKKFLLLQISVYLLVLYLLMIILLYLWNVWNGFNTYFWVITIIASSGLISLGVLSKKEGTTSVFDDKKEFVRIKKEEYEYLIARSQRLDELIKEKE